MATDRTVSLAVTNLRPLLAALKKTSGESPKAVAEYHKKIAELVATDAKRRADTRPRAVHTGHISRSIKVSGTQREAKLRVTAKDAKVQEFGGRAPLFGNRQLWHQVRPKRKGGYFLFPAIKTARPTIEKLYLDGLQKAIAKYWRT